MNIDEMRDCIVEDFKAAWSLNDAAHQIKHFMAVEMCGRAINDKLKLGYDNKLIMLVAMFHDLFCWSRHNHHNLSAEFIRTTDYYIIASLTTEERELVAIGCEEHRASRKVAFTHEFGEMMNSADRELPGDVEGMLERAVQYRLARGAANREEALPASIEHLKEKFGWSGYASYPLLYMKCFEDQLWVQRHEIMSL